MVKRRRRWSGRKVEGENMVECFLTLIKSELCCSYEDQINKRKKDMI